MKLLRHPLGLASMASLPLLLFATYCGLVCCYSQYVTSTPCWNKPQNRKSPS